MKRYFQNWKKIYMFAEYGDYDNYFIELAYACSRDDFKSSIGDPLVNKTAMNGLPIFGNVNIEFGKYTLLNERVEQQTNNLLFVYETYGYAPQKIYQVYSAEPTQRYGFEDPSGYLTKSINTNAANSYDVSADQFTLYLGNIDGLATGDMMTPMLNNLAAQRRATAAAVPIREINASNSYVVVDAFQFQFYNSNTNLPIGTATKTETIQWLRTSGVYCSLKREAATRTPSWRIANIVSNISFWTTFPNLDQKFVISDGQNETDTITDRTVPSVSEWKNMVANNEYYNVQDATVEIVYPGTFYKKILKQTIAR